jgi:hypothetical protein
MDGILEKPKRIGSTEFRKLPQDKQNEIKRKIEIELMGHFASGLPLAHIEPQICETVGVSTSVVKMVSESKEWQKKYLWARRKA